MTPIRLALDWTPNVNHIAFYVAQAKGYYQAAGLDVTLQNPADDNYATTPAKRVELGQADLALCPTESLLSYRTKAEPVPLLGIAALHRKDLSAIAVLTSSNVNSPGDLDGKIYASYQARYEDGIVRAMVRNDGGRGDLQITYPEKLGIWNRLLNGEADATWVFHNWEGALADASDHELRYFRLADYNVPYGYSPVIAGHADRLAERPEAFRDFLAATKRGHFYSRDQPAEAADILRPHLPDHDRQVDLKVALERTLPFIGSEKEWGSFDNVELQRFLDWLTEQELEARRFKAAEVVSEAYLR